MNVIIKPNRHNLSKFNEDGIFVILPMKDETFLDSIIKWESSNKKLCWKFELSEWGTPHGNHFVNGNGKDLYPETKQFLSFIADYYPEDLEFFIWHPEVFEGSFYGEHHDTDTTSPIDPSVLLVGLSVGQNTGA
jgi:hypothetical protein